MTVVKLSFLFYYPVSGYVLQTASRCESRAKCRDTSMHWRMIRIDTDFCFKNTDSPHEIVACLQIEGASTTLVSNNAERRERGGAQLI